MNANVCNEDGWEETEKVLNLSYPRNWFLLCDIEKQGFLSQLVLSNIYRGAGFTFYLFMRQRFISVLLTAGSPLTLVLCHLGAEFHFIT